MNECFIKVEKALCGKGNYWAVHEACIEGFRNGDFRRRHARRRATATASNNEAPNVAESQRYVPMTSTSLSSVVGLNVNNGTQSPKSNPGAMMPTGAYSSVNNYAQLQATQYGYHQYTSPMAGYPIQPEASAYPNSWMSFNNV